MLLIIGLICAPLQSSPSLPLVITIISSSQLQLCFISEIPSLWLRELLVSEGELSEQQSFTANNFERKKYKRLLERKG